jgi:hypothetical protein
MGKSICNRNVNSRTPDLNIFFGIANRTVTEATTVHGTNPQFLIEKILREKITDSLYWKEHCFALTGKQIVKE